jgi:hypothetical protein
MLFPVGLPTYSAELCDDLQIMTNTASFAGERAIALFS